MTLRAAWLGAAVVGALLAGCAADVTDTEPARTADGDTAVVTPSSPSHPATATGVEPAELHVPSIELREELIELGIQEDGTLEPPADWDDVGWFAGGPRPGSNGPTVFAGHVDSRTGPAIFTRVNELAVGDEIRVHGTDGSEHTYAVDRVEDHPKDDFPTRDVFGLSLEDELRLVTCIGEFDTVDLRHLDNRIVYATAVE